MYIDKHYTQTKGVYPDKFQRRQTPSLPFPPLPVPFRSSPLPLLSPPLYQLGGLGSAVSSPSRVWAKPQPLNNLVHI